jgi:hypothetical protein
MVLVVVQGVDVLLFMGADDGLVCEVCLIRHVLTGLLATSGSGI